MNFLVEVSEYCKQDVVNSARWYSFRQTGLGDRFVTAFETTVDLIAQNPEIGYSIATYVRRFSMRIFPYMIYYQVLSDTIRIVACLHGAREPREIEDVLRGRG